MAKCNVTLTPLLRREIIAAQSSDEGVAHIKRRLAEGDPKVNCFRVDDEGVPWFEGHLVVAVLWSQRIMSCAKRYLMKRTLPNIPSTPAAQRCIMI
jgi:hypothetical protein